MLNSGNKNCALHDKKKKKSNSLTEKKILNEKKPIAPRQVKWSVPKGSFIEI